MAVDSRDQDYGATVLHLFQPQQKESSLWRKSVGWCINGMPALVPVRTISDGIYTLHRKIPKCISFEQP